MMNRLMFKRMFLATLMVSSALSSCAVAMMKSPLAHMQSDAGSENNASTSSVLQTTPPVSAVTDNLNKSSPLNKGNEDNSSEESIYFAPDLVRTERLLLKRVRSSDEEVRGYLAIFDDYDQKMGWPTDYSTREEVVKQALEKEKFGYYQLQLSFGDYNIIHQEKNRIIGRLGIVKRNHNGNIETSIYVVSEFRRKGIAPEAITAFLKEVVDPGLGKTYLRESEGEEQSSSIPSVFRGVHAGCHLADHSIDNDLGSIAAHHKAGFGIKFGGNLYGTVNMSYPPGDSLNEEEVTSLINISALLQKCLNIKMNHRDYQHFWGQSVGIREIVRYPFYAMHVQELKDLYLDLLRTNQSETFLSVFSVLRSDFGMQHADLALLIPDEKASKVVTLFDKEGDEDYNLGLLKEFVSHKTSENSKALANAKSDNSPANSTAANSIVLDLPSEIAARREKVRHEKKRRTGSSPKK